VLPRRLVALVVHQRDAQLLGRPTELAQRQILGDGEVLAIAAPGHELARRLLPFPGPAAGRRMQPIH